MPSLEDLIRNWDEQKEDPKFTPFALYNEAGDSIEAYTSNEPRVAERINKLFSVFVAE